MTKAYDSTQAKVTMDRYQVDERQWQSTPPPSGAPRPENRNTAKHGQSQVLYQAVDQNTYGECRQSYRPNPTTYYQTHDHQFDGQTRRRPNYKPSALRWPCLLIMLLSLCAVIGLLAYGLRVLPVNGYDIPGLPHKHRKRDTSRSNEEPPVDSTGSSTSIVTGTRPHSNFGTIGSVTITTTPTNSPTLMPTRTDYGSIGSVTITSSQPGESPASDEHGSIGTVTIMASSKAPEDHGHIGTVTISTSDQMPTYISADIMTFTNPAGVATYTSTSIPSAISTPSTIVFTNALGEPTGTMVTSQLATPIISTLTDDRGVTTATVTTYPVLPSDTTFHVRVYYISALEYVVGFFLPTILSTLIALLVRIIDLNAKLFQPWHELTHAYGATGRESLCLATGGWRSIITSIRSLFGGQALVFLTTTLVVCSSLLVPLSAEAVGLNVQGGCQSGEAANKCAYELSVFDRPAKATLGLLGFMIIVTILLVCLLFRWQTGVSTNPWSICGIASLSANRDVRALFISSSAASSNTGRSTNDSLKRTLELRKFKLGCFRDAKGGMEYGVMLHDQYPESHPLFTPASNALVGDKDVDNYQHTQARHHLPFLMLGYLGRSLFLFVLLGLLALVLYYNNTGGDTPFERFMDSESFGVKFLFTGVGVLVTLFWSSFFSSKLLLSSKSSI